jgi:chromosome segregation ATPase
MTASETLEQQRKTIESQLAEARRARDDAALAVSDKTPGATEEFTAITAEVAGLERSLAMNEAARRALAKRNSADSLIKQRTAAKKAGKAAADTAVKRIELAKKIDAAFAAVAPLLKQWAELGASIQSGVRDVVDFAARENLTHRERTLDMLRPAATGSSAWAVLSSALASNQIGTLGVHHHELAFFRDHGITFADFAKSAADRIATSVARFADQIDEQA